MREPKGVCWRCETVPKTFMQLLRKKSTYAYVGKFNLGGTFTFDRGHKSTQINAKI